MAWRQILFSTRAIFQPCKTTGSARFSTKSNPYLGMQSESWNTRVFEWNWQWSGIPWAKLESEIGNFQKLLVTRTLRLKKLGVPCKHRKLILKYTHKYRLGLWRPRDQPFKT